MSLFKSSWDVENENSHSYNDEIINTTNNNTTNLNITATTHNISAQLLGVIATLLIIFATVVTLTLINTSITTSSTICCSNTITTIITTTTSTTVTTTTTTVDPYACSGMTFMNSTDLIGNDISPFPTMNYSTCCSYCKTTSGCMAFTWGIISNMCYRKTSAGSGGNYNVLYVSAKY